jgi:hypothetical protein
MNSNKASYDWIVFPKGQAGGNEYVPYYNTLNVFVVKDEGLMLTPACIAELGNPTHISMMHDDKGNVGIGRGSERSPFDHRLPKEGRMKRVSCKKLVVTLNLQPGRYKVVLSNGVLVFNKFRGEG